MGARGIIVLEGADGVGKTTLAGVLRERYGARYLHLGIHADIWRWHLAAVRRAVKLAETQLVVVDRLWLSEQVYGQVFRGGSKYDLGARCLDRVLQRYGAVTVLCVREDLQRHLRHFDWLCGERPEKFTSVRDVAIRYYDLARGNVAHPGDSYLDQLIRFGDYAQRRDVLTYDMDEHDTRYQVSVFAEQVVKRLPDLDEDLRQFNRGNLIGNVQDPEVLFVGEQLSPRAGTPWPFVWSDQLSAATWLNRALHELKFDETGGVWTNAISDDDWLPWLATFPRLKVIALGKVAAERASQFMRVHARLPHPQWHRRFAYHRPEEYTNLLKEALKS